MRLVMRYSAPESATAPEAPERSEHALGASREFGSGERVAVLDGVVGIDHFDDLCVPDMRLYSGSSSSSSSSSGRFGLRARNRAEIEFDFAHPHLAGRERYRRLVRGDDGLHVVSSVHEGGQLATHHDEDFDFWKIGQLLRVGSSRPRRCNSFVHSSR